MPSESTFPSCLNCFVAMFPHRFQNSYCGEEVAFLFHFLAFLQYWLVLPAACGGLLSCYLLYLFFQSSDNNDGNNMFISRSALASAYGIAFMLYGSTRFLTVKNCNILDSYMSLLAEQWKRHSNDLCFRWGTTHADSQSESPFAISSSHLLLLVLCLCVYATRQVKPVLGSRAVPKCTISSLIRMSTLFPCRDV